MVVYYLIDNNFEIYDACTSTGNSIGFNYSNSIHLKYSFIDVAISILGFIYVAILFSFIPLVSEKTNGEFFSLAYIL